MKHDPSWDSYGREAFSRGATVGSIVGFIVGLGVGAGIVVMVYSLAGW